MAELERKPRTLNPHNAYVIEGITDRAAFLKEAHYRARRDGQSTIIHHHKHGEPCKGKCEVITPEEQEDE